jgi:very-short-patch-repair endonuclease
VGRKTPQRPAKSGPPGGKERELAILAARQYGLVTGRQLADLGLATSAVTARGRAGRLHRVHRGVYAVGHPLLSRRGAWLAAVLAIAPDAMLSHRAAAALWDLMAPRPGRIDVTAPDRNGRERRSAIVVHRSRIPDPDRTVQDRIPVTSVARTLLDLAAILDRAALERAYARAERLQILDTRALAGLIERANGRRGLRALAALISSDTSAATRAASDLEHALLDLVREHGLPTPEVNAFVAGYEVDAYWPQARLVVEADGYEFHSDRSAFERDHAKLGRLLLAGYRVLPVTYRQVTREGAWVAGAIARLLTQGGTDNALQDGDTRPTPTV